MRLALLVTNTDDSDFAQSHPLDDRKFTDLIHLVRPDWEVVAFWVKDGNFPESLDDFDGALITGSPASVQGDADWITRLLSLIQDMHRQQMPMFGACFGHQAIALALGGRVGPNPDGWVHGLTHNQTLQRPDWAPNLPAVVKLYASHVEQVAEPPMEAQILARSQDCAISSFAIGRHVYTTQHHPEMTPAFIAALTEELAADMGDGVAEKARVSLIETSDMRVFAHSIARFFEQGVSPAPQASPSR